MSTYLQQPNKLGNHAFGQLATHCILAGIMNNSGFYKKQPKLAITIHVFAMLACIYVVSEYFS